MTLNSKQLTALVKRMYGGPKILRANDGSNKDVDLDIRYVIAYPLLTEVSSYIKSLVKYDLKIDGTRVIIPHSVIEDIRKAKGLEYKLTKNDLFNSFVDIAASDVRDNNIAYSFGLGIINVKGSLYAYSDSFNYIINPQGCVTTPYSTLKTYLLGYVSVSDYRYNDSFGSHPTDRYAITLHAGAFRMVKVGRSDISNGYNLIEYINVGGTRFSMAAFSNTLDEHQQYVVSESTRYNRKNQSLLIEALQQELDRVLAEEHARLQESIDSSKNRVSAS